MKFKIGRTALYLPPVPEGSNLAEHSAAFIRQQAAKGMDALSIPLPGLVYDQGVLEAIAAAKKETNMGLVVGTPSGTYFRNGLNDDIEGLAVIENSMKVAKAVGEKFVRIAYGRCDFDTSRYNKDRPDQIESIIKGMSKLLPLCEKYDIDVLIENHCDFSGLEYAKIMERLNSPRFGIFLDIGNDATVWVDIFAGNTAMLPYARYAGHIKDIAARKDPDHYSENNAQGRFPVQLYGCMIGEGLLDIKGYMKYLNDNCKPDDEFYFLVEKLWMLEGTDMDAYYNDGMKYLREVANSL